MEVDVKTSSVKLHLALVLLTLVLLPFQNCSLYKSEGRKFLEENGGDLLTEDLSSVSAGKPFSGCSPFLSSAAAQNIFQNPDVELKMSFEPVDNKYTCVVQDENQSTVCAISASQHGLLSEENKEIIADPHPDGALPGGSFGFVTVMASGKTLLQFVGGSAEAAPAVVHCTTSFATMEEYQQQTQKALQRVSNLVHEIISKI